MDIPRPSIEIYLESDPRIGPGRPWPEVVELQVEALAAFVRPDRSDRLPEIALAVLGHRVDAVARGVLM